MAEIIGHDGAVLLLLSTLALGAGPTLLAGLEAGKQPLAPLTELERTLLSLAEIPPPMAHDAVVTIIGAPPPQQALRWRPVQREQVMEGKWTVRAGAPAPMDLRDAALKDLVFFFEESGEELHPGVSGERAAVLLRRLAGTYEEQGRIEQAAQVWRRLLAEDLEAETQLEGRLALVRLHTARDDFAAAAAELARLQAMDAPEAQAEVAALLTRLAARAHIDALRDPAQVPVARQHYARAFALAPELARTPLAQTAAALGVVPP